MSRIIAFHYFCDNGKAAKHPPRTIEGDTILVWSPKRQEVVELDVCDPCLTKLKHLEVQVLADELGREIAEPEQDPELVCPFGCNNSKPFKSTGGRSRHMTTRHPDWEPEPK